MASSLHPVSSAEKWPAAPHGADEPSTSAASQQQHYVDYRRVASSRTTLFIIDPQVGCQRIGGWGWGSLGCHRVVQSSWSFSGADAPNESGTVSDSKAPSASSGSSMAPGLDLL